MDTSGVEDQFCVEGEGLDSQESELIRVDFPGVEHNLDGFSSCIM